MFTISCNTRSNGYSLLSGTMDVLDWMVTLNGLSNGWRGVDLDLTCLDHLHLHLAQLPLDRCPSHDLDCHLHLVHLTDLDHLLG
jgi:hypothetical protein